MKNILLTLIVLSIALGLQAQDNVFRTFKDSRAVNVHSVETLAKGKMDMRISHRFGDLAGDNGGWATFYGLETASDVAIGVEYGFTDKLTVGLYRSKGAGTSAAGDSGLKQLINTFAKWRMLHQKTDNSMPVSLTFMGLASTSTSKKLTGPGTDGVLASFPKFNHRMAFHGELILARKFSDNFSLQVIPGYTHRNLVPFEDENGMWSIGAATRIQLSRTLGLIADAVFPLIDSRTTELGYYPTIGVGLEIETSGHVFQVNFTNATGLMETDFIPYTTSNWADGEFRIGFTISRLFNI